MVFKIDKNRAITRAFKVAFVLMLCSSLLPWFDRGDNAPLFWGYEVVMEHYLWIPFVILILFIWTLEDKSKRWYALLGKQPLQEFWGSISIPSSISKDTYGLSMNLMPPWICILACPAQWEPLAVGIPGSSSLCSFSVVSLWQSEVGEIK